ncbi:MAG: cytochrome c biogenesis protein CcsA [Alphaproteobacteria bacterium]
MLLLFLILLLPGSAMADAGDFALLPVLHEGRVKPLDSFARWQLQAVHGADALPGRDAVAWLADVVFHPAAAAEEKIFIVYDRDAVHLLELPERPEPFYSFNEVAVGLLAQQPQIAAWARRESRRLAAVERETLRLYRAADDFRQLTGALALLLPVSLELSSDARAQAGIAADAPVTYLDLLKIKPALMQRLGAILAAKQERLELYTPEEQDAAKLGYQLRLIESIGANNTLFRVIPPLWEGQEEWRAPWALLLQGYGAPSGLSLFRAWQEAAAAWRQEGRAGWAAAAAQLRLATLQVAPPMRPGVFAVEQALHKYAPGEVALGLVLVGVVALGLAYGRGGRFWRGAGYGALVGGLVVLGLLIAARMFILLRPPVSTLYESTLFVAFVALAGGLVLAGRRGLEEGALLGSVIAVLLLVCSRVFGADGDTLRVLTAVLDTNFWLATHVVCITSGYGATLLAGMMAHLYLIRRVLGTPSAAVRPLVTRSQGVMLVALLLTTAGTMLGGIWADQSWGRFWGWDPKENGALWIVLWLIWLLHGRLAGQLGVLAQMAGLALVNIVVALAWFGVNLLSVGLHSYGFTDAAAFGLGVFCVGELVLIGGMTGYIMRRRCEETR